VTINSLSKSLRLPPPLIDLLAPTYALDHVQLTGLTAEEWVAANGDSLGLLANSAAAGGSGVASGAAASSTSVRTPAGGGRRAFSASTARAAFAAAGSSTVATAIEVDQQLEVPGQDGDDVEVLSQALGAVTLGHTSATATATTTTANAHISHLERSYQAPAVPHPIDTQPPLFARAWEGLFGVVLVAHSESGSTKVNSFEQELVKQVLAAGGKGQVRQRLDLSLSCIMRQA
jgi:hypothetical protein